MTTSWYAFDARQRERDRKFAEPKPVNRNSNPVPSRSESKRTPMRPVPLPGSRIWETGETTEGSAEPVVRIHLSPADSPSLSGFRLRPGKDADFPPFWQPCGAAASAETRKVQQYRAEEG